MGFTAVVVNACGNTSVSCLDLASCPEGTGGSLEAGPADSMANTADGRDGAGGMSARDALASETGADISVVPDGGARPDASVEAAAETAAPEPREGEAGVVDTGIADVTAEEVGPVCEAGADPAVEPCVVNDGYGVFVSPAGRDNSDGSKAAPFRTIGHAIGLALARGGRVFACGSMGVYAETLAVGVSANGVALYGGFDCTTWVHSSALRTIVRPTTPGLALGVTGVTSLVVEDFEFDSANAGAPGDSSIAVFLASSTGVVFTRVRAVAGNGAPGAAGAGNAGAAAAGVGGGSSNAACTPLFVAPPATRACGDEQTSGGNAGAGASIAGAPGSTGGQGASTPALSTPAGQGGAGEGQSDSVAWDCSSVDTGAGQIGGGGVRGAPGTGATASGMLTAIGWQATSGTAGLNGHIGQGGGGGGGARAPGTCAGADAGLPVGASGGSGGSGGCGGLAGGGGGSGGSSIAILSFSSQLSLSGCEIVTGIAGRGGNGGNGQVGGPGGAGGDFSLGFNGSNRSCAGGPGGGGGNGGPGGGGAGGISVGVVSSATGGSVVVPAGNTFQLGTAGAAGLDGNASPAGPGAGAAGTAQNQLSL
jgi:hypothetical protein